MHYKYKIFYNKNKKNYLFWDSFFIFPVNYIIK